MNRLARVLACAFLFGCAAQPGTGSTKAADSDAVSILLFGDTGYDYDWLEEDDYEDAFTGREFVINELDDWIEDHRRIEEFEIQTLIDRHRQGGRARGMRWILKIELQ